jgi:hypothetical protein
VGLSPVNEQTLCFLILPRMWTPGGQAILRLALPQVKLVSSTESPRVSWRLAYLDPVPVGTGS